MGRIAASFVRFVIRSIETVPSIVGFDVTFIHGRPASWCGSWPVPPAACRPPDQESTGQEQREARERWRAAATAKTKQQNSSGQRRRAPAPRASLRALPRRAPPSAAGGGELPGRSPPFAPRAVRFLPRVRLLPCLAAAAGSRATRLLRFAHRGGEVPRLPPSARSTPREMGLRVTG
uniref:Uncharacterized protein n=1 Tax=Oryza sativa subsp. japonica TaxID=39947 RepID=Q6Z0W3_ORYSJ|nr:hypothetical protein [Oryza sativa Japonica Group]